MAPRASSSCPTRRATMQSNCKQNLFPITCARPFCFTPRSSLPTPARPSPALHRTSLSSWATAYSRILSWHTISRTRGLLPRALPRISGSPLRRTRLSTMPARAQGEIPRVHRWPCGRRACGSVRVSGCGGPRGGLSSGTWKACVNAGVEGRFVRRGLDSGNRADNRGWFRWAKGLLPD